METRIEKGIITTEDQLSTNFQVYKYKLTHFL